MTPRVPNPYTIHDSTLSLPLSVGKRVTEGVGPEDVFGSMVRSVPKDQSCLPLCVDRPSAIARAGWVW